MARIGIDVTSALTQGGGIGRYTREIVRALTELSRTHQLTLFSAKPPAQTPVPNPLPIADNITHTPAPVDEHWLYRVWYRARLPIPVQAVTGKLDLFHSPDFVLPPTSGNIPTLLTVHDLSFVKYAEVYPPKLVNYLNRVVPWSVKRATHVVVDSAETARDLKDLYNTPDSKITILYAGVSDHFHPITREKTIQATRTKYHLGQKPYILSVGTVQPRKNYEMLIHAFAQIAPDWPHNLVIAGGKGWLMDEMDTLISNLQLQNRVKITGFVDDADLPALYSDATLFAFPSLYEGFGLPILEAMACGAPVLSSDASCLPEVVGDAGIMLPPHDPTEWSIHMHKLLLDAPRRAKLVGTGILQSQKFTWWNTATQLTHIYEGLLS